MNIPVTANSAPLTFWPTGNLTRVPYHLYQEPAVLDVEQKRVFEGETWNFLCLEAELPKPGDYRTTFLGRMPVVVARDSDDEVYAFENRCSHRGALIVLDDRGTARDFQCVYHAWRYDRQGNLKGIAFQNGVNGEGGMDPAFCMKSHGPRKLRTSVFCGLVFGSLSDDVPDLEDYLGSDVVRGISRVLNKPVQILGRFTQTLPNNWKLYVENVRDTYHASLLHVFFTTFRLNRLSQKGGVVVSECGGNHISFSAIDLTADKSEDYQTEELRSEKDDFKLEDSSLLKGLDEFGDGVTLQILSVFPGFVLAQIQNTLAVRQVLPDGIDSTVLNWVYLGFKDDTPELRAMRHKQSNLIGPAGFVSMEDGAVGGFVQRGIASASGQQAIVEMGGDSVRSQTSRTTEASVRGFWKTYRTHMGAGA
jgi:anthranilate 1,2-dioxygenase large subunit/terephthalate 1,2-dioxygenase oxygenase component alpha subunit